MRTSTTQALKPRGVVAAIVFMVVAVLAVTTVALTVGASGADAAKPVGTTYTNTTQITIPDSGQATPYPSEIVVPSTRGRIKDVNVTLKGFSHTWPGDVSATLVGPQGQYAVVMSNVGGRDDVSGIDLTLDDQAAVPLPPAADPLPYPLATGTYQPSGPLSVFNRTNATGTWSLNVEDLSAQDSGVFQGGWALQIK